MKTNNLLSGNHFKKSNDILYQLLFIAVIIAMIYPIVFAVSTSFKTLPEVYNNSFGLVPQAPTTAAYLGVLSKIPFIRITLNTFIVAALVTFF